MARADAFGARVALPGVDGIDYYRLARLREQGIGDPSRLPVTVRILLENVLRHSGESYVEEGDVEAVARWDGRPLENDRERAFVPARVLLQDFTGVPAVVDLAAMRNAMARG